MAKITTETPKAQPMNQNDIGSPFHNFAPAVPLFVTMPRVRGGMEYFSIPSGELNDWMATQFILAQLAAADINFSCLTMMSEESRLVADDPAHDQCRHPVLLLLAELGYDFYCGTIFFEGRIVASPCKAWNEERELHESAGSVMVRGSLESIYADLSNIDVVTGAGVTNPKSFQDRLAVVDEAERASRYYVGECYIDIRRPDYNNPSSMNRFAAYNLLAGSRKEQASRLPLDRESELWELMGPGFVKMFGTN